MTRSPADESAPDEPVPPSSGTVDEASLHAVTRDWRFVVRLALLCLVGLIAALFVGAKIQGAAGGCGAGLIRPGSSVIPPTQR